ncbi:MAG TPA: SH3 domain-containing protein, partial [Anaerolineales bacterium]|nr:SH3 domain-containing protein [Anaerolineales bacterium]
TTRYKYNGAKLATEISAVLWFNNYGINTPEPPQKTKLPLPAEKYVVYAAEDDLALRADGSVTGYLWKRMLMNTELISLEDKAKAKAKIGVQGQWLQVQDPQGDQGFVAAWYVSEKKGSASTSTTTTVTTPTLDSTPTPGGSGTGVPVPAGALALIPTAQISLRSKPVISPDNIIRYVQPTEQLISLEPANVAIPKVGVQNQWIKVRDASKKEGYVAAWYVKYEGGSTAQTTTSTTSGGTIKVRTTVESVSLRNQPVVSDATLIKRVPINYEFTITEPGGESKIGANNQWIKVKDATNEGYIAAWFVTR